MTKYGLLQLFPTGNGSGNRELTSCMALTITDAIYYFKTIYPEVNLDKDGYAKRVTSPIASRNTLKLPLINIALLGSIKLTLLNNLTILSI